MQEASYYFKFGYESSLDANTTTNWHHRVKRQVLIRPNSKVFIKFSQCMQK